VRDDHYFKNFGLTKTLVELGPGSVVGEESVFEDQTVEYNILARSGTVKLFRITKTDIMSWFNKEMITNLIQNFKLKT
jgi:CRP-like cAMP-binding protein